MKPNPTAIDLVTLVRRYKALGGSSSLSFLDTADVAPEVMACIAPIAEAEPLAWKPERVHMDPSDPLPAIFCMTVEGVSIDIWCAPKPESADGSRPEPGVHFAAADRAGALLLDMAGMGPKRRARKAA